MDLDFVLKIKTDPKGDKLDLRSMPIEAARNFLILYESLLQLVRLTDKDNSTRISITKGSLALGISGPSVVNRMMQDFETVIDSQCEDPEKVKYWKNIQQVFQLNGYDYDLTVKNGDMTESYYARIKESKRFYKKRTKKKYTSAIRFLNGKLTDAGGKRLSNIHLDVSGGSVRIKCSQKDAVLAGSHLYQHLQIGTWIKIDNLGNYNYELCDVYFEDGLMQEFKSFFEQLENLTEVDALRQIHKKVTSYLTEGDLHKLQAITRLWIHQSTDIQTLKIVLVATKPVKDREEYAMYREKISLLFDTKFANEMKTHQNTHQKKWQLKTS